MSGYRQAINNYGSGTGPMFADRTHLERTPKLKLCFKCDAQRDPAGGVEINAKKWICAPCWKPHLLSKMKNRR